jgi:hypothetical protein
MSQARDLSRSNQRKHNVRRARLPNLKYEDLSELGRDLYDLSRAYEDSGGPLLTEDEIENEVVRRRGGHTQKDVI